MTESGFSVYTTSTSAPTTVDGFAQTDGNTCASTPEPSDLISGVLAVLAGMGYAWRRRRRVPAAG